MRKVLSVVLTFLMLASVLPASATQDALSEDIVILYTNDIHTYIDGPISYDTLAAIKQELKAQYKYVFLADAGDHVQGTAYGSMDKGESIIALMNGAGYDAATLGNHEFDYNMQGCKNLISLADFPYVSANFYHEKDGVRGENVLNPYVTFDCGDETLAILGITTPESLTKSTPAYFQDEAGSFIYGISGGEDGDALRKDVQSAIDDAKAQGATKVIALGHLGIDGASSPWTSKETIAGVCGLDAFIDGHSHHAIEKEIVSDAHGHDVVLTQTGEYFNCIGMMVIDSETGDITTDFIECEEVLAEDGETVTGHKLSSDLYGNTALPSDAKTKEIKDAWISQIDEKLGEVIGKTTVVFDNYDQDGNRLVRNQETNSGDFAADALYYLFDNMGMAVDVAIMNGGGIRNSAITGDITYKTCKDMHPFGNVACLQAVTGQQILDALEWGARSVGEGENGSFLQVSGLTYKINTAVDSTVLEKELEVWGGAPDTYRVYDVKIYDRGKERYVDIDLDATYYLAGYNYTLRDLGGGFAMFEDSACVLDYVMEDYMVLANYVKGFEGGIIDGTNAPLAQQYPGFLADYSDVGGDGRIQITSGEKHDFTDRVWVGGIPVTAENCDDVLGDGGSVTYDDATNTLTLTDATIKNDAGHGIYAYGQDLIINGIDTDAPGANEIAGTRVETSGADSEGNEFTETESGCGIYVEGDGYADNGGLVIFGTLGDIYGDAGSGIEAYRNIDISATIGDISCTGGLSSSIESVFGYVAIHEKAVLGNLISEDYNGISADSDLIISGLVHRILGGYDGLYTKAGHIYIAGAVKKIYGAHCGIEAYDSVDWDENGEKFYYGGGVAISGTVADIAGGIIGIWAEADLNVKGKTTITVTPEETDGETAMRAVSVGGEIILTDDHVVVKPAEYEIGKIVADEYENEDGKVTLWHNTFFAGENEPATVVEFAGFVNPFTDVKIADWFYSDMKYAVQNGLMNGLTDVLFAPNEKLSRAMLVTVLYRAEGSPAVNRSIPFEDVTSGSWYENAVIWAQQNGIVKGVSDTSFAPDTHITREQIATIMYRYAVYKGVAPSGAWAIRLEYGDVADISEFAVEGIMYCTKDGLMQGKGENLFCPKDHATRAETAAILHRFLEQ